MGMFTYIAQNTNKTIGMNIEAKIITPHGEQARGFCDGYGRIGGVTWTEIFAELNGYPRSHEEGMDLWISHIKDPTLCFEFPKIVTIGFKGKYTDIKGIPEMTQKGL